MTAGLQQAVAHYAHASDGLKVPEPQAAPAEGTTWSSQAAPVPARAVRLVTADTTGPGAGLLALRANTATP